MKNYTVAQVLAKAQEFEEQEKYEQAYECYKDAYESDKSNTEVLTQLAICAQTLHYKEDAVKYWTALMSLNPENPLPYNQLLDLYFADDKYSYYLTRAKLKTLEGRLEQAAVDYKKAISNTNDEKQNIDARYLLAQKYEILDKPMHAIDEYLRILDYNHDENVYSALAKIYYNNDKSAAVSVLIQGLKHFPQNSLFKELLSKIFMELEDYDKALEYAQNDMTKIKIHLAKEDNDAAYDLLEKLSDKDKKTPKYFALAAEYFYNQGNDDKALELIEKYESLDSESPLASQMRALVYEKQNQPAKAHFHWGKYYIKKNAHDLALNEFLCAHAANGSDAAVIEMLISVYSALDDNISMIEFCEKLVELKKDDTATLKKLANFYEQEGYKEKAVNYLSALYELNPRDYETLLKLAKFAESDKRTGDAIEYYENYLKFAPSSDERNTAEKRLSLLTTGEDTEEEGFLDKILGLFSRK